MCVLYVLSISKDLLNISNKNDLGVKFIINTHLI